jgi:CubicO group peptidase (beta-lactamase class C family)
VKGTTWEELVKQYIAVPLEMEGFNFSIEASEKTGNYALPYAENEGKLIKIPFYREMRGIGPAGSINANIYEMLKWVKLQLQEGKWEGDPVISEKNLQVIHTPQFVVGGGMMLSMLNRFKELSHPTYGMGWFVQNYRGNMLIHHGGNIDGFSALVSFMPDIEAGIVILTNKNGTLLTMATAFHIYDKLRGLKKIDWNGRLQEVQAEKIKEMAAEEEKRKKSRKTGEGAHDPADVLAGTYKHGAYGVMTVFLKEEKLALKFHKFEAGLKHIGGNDFELEGPVVGGLPIRFLKGTEGKINGLSAPLEPQVEDIIFKKQ